jgi:hypothetical protein
MRIVENSQQGFKDFWTAFHVAIESMLAPLGERG